MLLIPLTEAAQREQGDRLTSGHPQTCLHGHCSRGRAEGLYLSYGLEMYWAERKYIFTPIPSANPTYIVVKFLWRFPVV